MSIIAHMKDVNHILAAGAPAPDFSLHATPDQLVSLSDFRGRPVILAFYPADWSPVCGDQMALYNELLNEFHHFGAELLGVSVDGAWCHVAFAHDRKLRFPLLSDFEPKGQVARMYGAYKLNGSWLEHATTYHMKHMRSDQQHAQDSCKQQVQAGGIMARCGLKQWPSFSLSCRICLRRLFF